MEAVSIILKTWNAARYVRLCLEYLLKNTEGEFELIIVDNGSEARLVDDLSLQAEGDSRVRLIQNERNMGPGFANRQGMEVAAYQLVCLMDSDVLVPAGWLGKLVAEMVNHPGIKMITPLKHEECNLYPFGVAQPDSRQVWFETKRETRGLSPKNQFLRYSQGFSLEEFSELMVGANPGEVETIVAPPDFLGTSCALVDRGFVEGVGGVADPDFRAYGSEDVDLCWRIGAAGGLVAKSHSVYVHHFHGASLEDNRLERSSALVLANQILYNKWKERLLKHLLGVAQENCPDLVDYLERHFIYHQLAQNTPFLYDLRSALLQAGINFNLPQEIIWRGGYSQ